MLLRLSCMHTWLSAGCHIVFITYTTLLLQTNKSDPYQILSSIFSKYECFLLSGYEKLAYQTFNTVWHESREVNADDRGDYNSSPIVSYRQANENEQ